MRIKIKKKYLLIIVLVLIVGVFGTTLAYFNANVIGSATNSSGISTGTFELSVSDSSVNLSNTAPIYDDYYLTQAYHKTFTVTNSNTSTLNVCAKISLEITFISESLKSDYFKYKIVSSDGKENSGSFYDASTSKDSIILNGNFIEPNETQTFDLYIWIGYTSSFNQVSMLGTSFIANIKAIGFDSKNESSCKWYDFCLSSDNDIKCTILNDNTAYADNINSLYVQNTTPGIDFAAISSDTNGKGLYYTTDTSKTENGERVYYFRGAVENNYLIFANYCWRIVRTNEDGSVKLRYGGVPTTTDGVTSCPQTGTDVSIGSSKFNTTYNDNAYVGYTYGTVGSSTYALTHTNTNNSTIKGVIDSWYSNISSYASYIADTPYCNDRSITDATYNLGYGTNQTYYAAYTRLNTNKTPTFKCARNDDKFTVSNTYGNGSLTYSIGLLTADEVAYAGGVYGQGNSSYYLYTSQNYWTMSPFDFYSGYSFVFYVYSAGSLNYLDVDFSNRVAPAVSLTSGTLVQSGTGVYNSPYVLQ